MRTFLGFAGVFLLLGAGVSAANETEVTARLKKDVEALAIGIGARSVGVGDSLKRAEELVARELTMAGWTVTRETYAVGGVECANLVAEKRGTAQPEEIVVVGAHYDTVPTTPGADDNASGVALLLELARELKEVAPARTLRLVAFANEEPIYFQTEFMGSRVYARGCKSRGENIAAMLSLECLGYFTDQPKTQKYPFPLSLFYPSTGNFVAIVGNRASKALVRQVKESFEASGAIAGESIAMPDVLPGIGWSDHWSFWQEGYPAVMLTDTALNRNPHYHRVGDHPMTLNYSQMAKAAQALESAVRDLVK